MTAIAMPAAFFLSFFIMVCAILILHQFIHEFLFLAFFYFFFKQFLGFREIWAVLCIPFHLNKCLISPSTQLQPRGFIFQNVFLGEGKLIDFFTFLLMKIRYWLGLYKIQMGEVLFKGGVAIARIQYIYDSWIKRAYLFSYTIRLSGTEPTLKISVT